MYDATLEFDTPHEVIEYLAMGGFRRLPVKGVIQRWVANEVDDDGARLVTFASSTLSRDPERGVRVNLTSRRA